MDRLRKSLAQSSMEKGPGLVCILVLTASVLSASEALKIGSVDLQVLNLDKISTPGVLSILTQIVHRYDIFSLQGIQDDSEQTVLTNLTNTINTGSDSGDVYQLVVSGKVGRLPEEKEFKQEQYAFLYRSSVVEVVATYQYVNVFENQFEKPPFSVLFRTIEGGNEFFLMGIRVRQAHAISEIETLGPAFTLASAAFNSISRGAIVGDMRAGCSWMNQTTYEGLSLVNDPDFVWLFGYDVVTTVGISCPYSKVIVHETLYSSVVENSSAVFNFTEAYSLTTSQAEEASVNLPLEFELQDSSLQTLPNITLLLGLVTMATTYLFFGQ